jgi:hypothetical protein
VVGESSSEDCEKKSAQATRVYRARRLSDAPVDRQLRLTFVNRRRRNLATTLSSAAAHQLLFCAPMPKTSPAELESLDDQTLAAACGGVRMQLTQYGYPGDPYSDSYTRKGLGAYRHLDRNNSIALTTSGLAALGLTRSDVRHHHYWVQFRVPGGGMEMRRIDDWAPEKNKRIDLYMPRGYNHRLPDYTEVQLVPRAIPVHHR